MSLWQVCLVPMRQHTVHTPYIVGEAHFYSTEINGDLVLFDTGPATPEALAFLQREIDLPRLKYVFITHCHVDHYGLAAHIAANSGAEIFLPRQDAVKLQHHAERIGQIRTLLTDCGFDDRFGRELREMFEKNKVFPVVPERYGIVEESDVPAKLGISWLNCPGHSQSDLVYLCGSHAITGDILLRNIFQAPLLDVDLDTFSERFRNFDAYCSSILKLQQVRGYEILPGHRGHVVSLDNTILFYVRKLLERAAQVKRYGSVEKVSGVVRELFGETVADPFVVYLKVSEIVFMRDFLAAPHLLKDSLERIGLFDAVRDLYASVAD